MSRLIQAIDRTVPPRLGIALAALIFSTGGVAIKMANFTGWQVASFRSGAAALTLLVLLPSVHRSITRRALLVAVAYAATLVLFVLANRLTTSANTIYLQSTAPLFVMLLSPWLLRERVRPRDLPVLAAVTVGMLLVLSGNDAPSGTAPDPLTGNLLALGSGMTYALLLCGLRWIGRDGGGQEESLAAVVMGNTLACLGALPMALPVAGPVATDWLVIGYLGVVQIALAYLLVAGGLRRVPALDASLLLLVETAFNPLWTWLLLVERPSPGAVVGGVVIIGATALQAVASARGVGRTGTGMITLIETVRMRAGRAPLWLLHRERLGRSALALGVPLPEIAEPRGGDDRIIRYEVNAEGVQQVERELPPIGPIALATSPAPHRGYRHKVAERGWLEAARLSVQSLGADDALLLDPQGLVVEATHWAIGWWEGEQLHFPPLTLGGLDSVSRVRLARTVRGGIRIAPLGRDALAWRSLVACNAARGLVPVDSVDGEPVPGNRRTEAIQGRFWQAGPG